HVVHNGRLQSAVHQGTLRAADARRAARSPGTPVSRSPPRNPPITAAGGVSGSVAVPAAEGTPGGLVRGADPRISGPVDGGPTQAAAQAAPEEVTAHPAIRRIIVRLQAADERR